MRKTPKTPDIVYEEGAPGDKHNFGDHCSFRSTVQNQLSAPWESEDTDLDFNFASSPMPTKYMPGETVWAYSPSFGRWFKCLVAGKGGLYTVNVYSDEYKEKSPNSRGHFSATRVRLEEPEKIVENFSL